MCGFDSIRRFSFMLTDSHYQENFNCTVVNTQSFVYINITFKNISGTNGLFMGKACSTHEKVMLKNNQKTEVNLLLNKPRHRLLRDTKMNHE
jgi:hypothetical protein